MKILINYNNIKKILITSNYQSIFSIINQYLNENNINYNNENFFLDYNGLYLNQNYSLEKYNILEDSILNLNEKIKGGNSFFSYAAKNPLQVFIAMSIALMPIFILPLGFVPLTSTLLKLIVENSIYKIGKYLACTYGKVTLFSRMKLFLLIFKYLVFFLMIYVIISFPIMILCITLKGHSLGDEPKSMCRGIKASSLAGMILTGIFVFIYLSLRFGKYVIDFFISIFKNFYILDTTINPLLKTILDMYNKYKYLMITLIYPIGTYFATYFSILDTLIPALMIFLSTVIELGCNFSLNKGKDMIMSKIGSMGNGKNMMGSMGDAKGMMGSMGDSKGMMGSMGDSKGMMGSMGDSKGMMGSLGDAKGMMGSMGDTKGMKGGYNINNNDERIFFGEKNQLCIVTENSACCTSEAFVSIADKILLILQNPISSSLIKQFGIFPAFILLVEGLYEAALLNIAESEIFFQKSDEEKKFYLQKLLENKSNKLAEENKDLIKEYLKTQDETKIKNIRNRLNIIFPIKEEDKILKNNIDDKLNNVDELMNNYAIKSGSSYIRGKSLFKTIFRSLFLNLYCNSVTTMKSTTDLVSQLGEVGELVDLLKSGTTAGFFTGIAYFIAVIILIICSIFNVF